VVCATTGFVLKLDKIIAAIMILMIITVATLFPLFTWDISS
jgi:hypothetical protein